MYFTLIYATNYQKNKKLKIELCKIEYFFFTVILKLKQMQR